MEIWLHLRAFNGSNMSPEPRSNDTLTVKRKLHYRGFRLLGNWKCLFVVSYKKTKTNLHYKSSELWTIFSVNVRIIAKNVDLNVGHKWRSNRRSVCPPEEGAWCDGVQLQLSGSGSPQSVRSLLGTAVQRLHPLLLVQATLCPLQQGHTTGAHSQQHQGSGLCLCKWQQKT